MPKFSKSSAELLNRHKISPIVEFFEMDMGDVDWFVDTSRPDREELKSILKKSKGIYAFYNSEAEVIYVGKTKANLWSEMKNAYTRKMEHYTRFFVNHPKKYQISKSGMTRRIQRKNFCIWNVASFFSAYHIEDDRLIDVVETMMIRMMPNDLINVRMEGNGVLRARVLRQQHG